MEIEDEYDVDEMVSILIERGRIYKDTEFLERIKTHEEWKEAQDAVTMLKLIFSSFDYEKTHRDYLTELIMKFVRGPKGKNTISRSVLEQMLSAKRNGFVSS